jgi:hypothetical protein
MASSSKKQLSESQLEALARGRAKAAEKRAEMNGVAPAAPPVPAQAVEPPPVQQQHVEEQPAVPQPMAIEQLPVAKKASRKKKVVVVAASSDSDAESDSSDDEPVVVKRKAKKPAEPPAYLVDYYRSKQDFYNARADRERVESTRTQAREIQSQDKVVAVAKQDLQRKTADLYKQRAWASLFPGVPMPNDF